VLSSLAPPLALSWGPGNRWLVALRHGESPFRTPRRGSSRLFPRPRPHRQRCLAAYLNNPIAILFLEDP